MNLWTYIRKEKVMTVALSLAIVSALFVHSDHKYWDYIDWRVLALLFCLMVVVKGIQDIGVFDIFIQKLYRKVDHLRSIIRMLVLMCFFGSMVITNDVALITFVPFAIVALKTAKQEKYLIITVILQTLAANLGSMFTPIGNPQNLYLFSAANMSIVEFFGTMWPVTLLSFVLLMLAVQLIIPATKLEPIENGNFSIQEGNRISIDLSVQKKTDSDGMGKKCESICYTILFGIDLLVVFHAIHWEAAFIITILGILLMRKKELFAKVDYALLLTFVGFFVFIGNIGRVPAISQMVQELLEGREVWMSALFSQFMSNVPAAILLSGFTNRYQALLLGTNIGGLGTLIASMASLISYKLYAEEPGSSRGKYFIQFTIWNIIGLIILLAAAFFIY